MAFFLYEIWPTWRLRKVGAHRVRGFEKKSCVQLPDTGEDGGDFFFEGALGLDDLIEIVCDAMDRRCATMRLRRMLFMSAASSVVMDKILFPRLAKAAGS